MRSGLCIDMQYVTKISQLSGLAQLAEKEYFNILHRCPGFAGPEPYSRKAFK